MIAKYRLYCETESQWKYTDWISEAPTECPDNGGHTIDTDSIVVIETECGVFGKEYTYEESLSESSTTSTSWQEKLDLNVTDISAGDYKIVWTFEWTFSRKTDPGASFGIHIDWGAQTLSETEMTPNQTYGEGSFYLASSFGKATLTAGSHKIALNYHSGGDGSTTYIRRAKLELWRIA